MVPVTALGLDGMLVGQERLEADGAVLGNAASHARSPPSRGRCLSRTVTELLVT